MPIRENCERGEALSVSDYEHERKAGEQCMGDFGRGEESAEQKRMD